MVFIDLEKVMSKSPFGSNIDDDDVLIKKK